MIEGITKAGGAAWLILRLASMMIPAADAPRENTRQAAITNIAEVRQLARPAAALNHPVRVQAVVTYWDPATLDLFVQDASDGIFAVALSPDLPVSVGRWLEIEGVTSPGGFTRTINQPHIRFLSRNDPLPPAKRVEVSRFLEGAEDARLVQLEGIVQQAQEDGGRLLLWLRAGGLKAQVVIRQTAPRLEVRTLVRRRAKIQGVCATSMKHNGELETVRLLVNSFADLELGPPEPVPAGPAKIRKAAELLAWPRNALPDEPVRISGLARGETPEGILVEDATGSIPVEAWNPTHAQYPTEAAGFLETNGAGKIFLADAFTTQTAPCKQRLAPGLGQTVPIDPKNTHPILTDIQQVRQLPREEAYRGYPVHLRGSVTWHGHATMNFCLQEGAAGIFVDVEEPFPEEFGYGSVVQVEGYCDQGEFAPFIREGRFKLTGEHRLPTPWTGNPAQLASGFYDGHWVEVEGVVRSVSPGASDSLAIKLAAGGCVFTNFLPRALSAGRRLPGEDASLRIRGICNIIPLGSKAQGFEILSPGWEHVEELQAPRDIHRLPVARIGRLFTASPEMSSGHRVRLRGSVTYGLGGRLYIGEEVDGLRVCPRQPQHCEPGEVLEVAGFPVKTGAGVVLEDADITSLGKERPLEPIECTLAQILAGHYQNRLVRIADLKLVDHYTLASGMVFILQSGPQVCEARLDLPQARAGLEGLEAGSLVTLTGICQTEADTHAQAGQATLLLRSPADLSGVVPPSGWTHRTWTVLGVSALAILASLLWILLLRRRVQEQTSSIRERLRREAALERRYRQLVENANDMVFTLNHEGCFTSVNPACERITGYTQAEALQMNIAQWVAPASATGGMPGLKQLASGTNVPACEVEILARSGQHISLELSMQPIHEQGVVTGIQGIARDLTERHRLEAQLRQAQKLEAIGTLAGGIAHDFNNILAAIIPNAELAREDAAGNAAVQENLQEILAASERARSLVQQILAISRKQKQERRVIRLQPIIKESLRLLRSALPAMIGIETDVREDAPPVFADPSQIHQVLMNLGANAGYALKDHPGRIHVSCEAFTVDDELARFQPDLQPGPYCKLSVADNGPGMDGATLKRVFEPFFTTKPVGEGTGLGLAVVHGIVKSHNGSIQVDSEPGQGAAFHIYLPAAAAGEAAGAGAPPPLKMGAGERILFVDDEESLCQVARRSLERLGYRATIASNPEAALRQIQDQPRDFDLVLTDLSMPAMTGIDLARKILLLQPGLPILVATGFPGKWTSEELLKYGIRQLLFKPYSVESLGQILHQTLHPPPAGGAAPPGR